MTDEKALTTTEEQKGKQLMVSSKGYLVPDSLDTQWKMASLFSKSGLAPKGMERVETLFTAMQLGAEVGLAPMQAIQSIAVINGRPTIWGDAQLALVKAHPDYEYIKERIHGTGNDMYAECEIKRRSEIVSVMHTFSIDDAKRAGLWGKSGPWSQYPKRMLQMRARAFAIRDSFPDVLKGLSVTREEALDMQEINGTYQAPEAAQVQEAINKTREQKPAVDKTTGEVNVWDRTHWINLRAAGFERYVADNWRTLVEQPDDIITEVKNKWFKLYPDTEFPVNFGEQEKEPEQENIDPDAQNPELTSPKKRACPDREGDMIFEDYCMEECQNREGCPAWEADDILQREA